MKIRRILGRIIKIDDLDQKMHLQIVEDRLLATLDVVIFNRDTGDYCMYIDLGPCQAYFKDKKRHRTRFDGVSIRKLFNWLKQYYDYDSKISFKKIEKKILVLIDNENGATETAIAEL